MSRVLVNSAIAPAPGWLQADAAQGGAWNTPISGTVFGAHMNVKSALDALGDAVNAAPYKAPPAAPVLYIKPPNTFRPDGGVVPVPTGVEALEVNATLAVVFGKATSRVSEAQALEHVLGYAVAIDVCIPHANVYRPAIRQRCRDGFLPIGPWVMERAAVADPDDLTVTVEVNGEARSRFSTRELIRPVARLIQDVSDFMTFAAGDVLLVGLPANGPQAKAGDKVVAEIGGVGRLSCALAPEAATEWSA